MLDRREEGESSEQEDKEMDWADNMDGLEILLYEDDALQGPASEPPAVLEPVLENEDGIVTAQDGNNHQHQQPQEGLVVIWCQWPWHRQKLWQRSSRCQQPLLMTTTAATTCMSVLRGQIETWKGGGQFSQAV
jgi:hypothetical protein